MKLKITKIKPMFNAVLTTMDKYEEDVTAGKLIDGSKTKGTIKEYQRVLEVGPAARVNVGDLVMINPSRYADVQHKHKKNSLGQYDSEDFTSITYHFNVVNVNGKDCLLINDNDIDFVFEGEEIPETDLVVPKTILVH